jgi:hypothetical protein
MKNLPHALHEVAAVLEMLRQRHDVRQRLPKMSGEIIHFRGVRSRAREQAGTRGRANGLLAIGPFKNHPPLGEAINIRGLNDVIAIAAQLRAQIIHGDEENIRFRGKLGISRGRAHYVHSQQRDKDTKSLPPEAVQNPGMPGDHPHLSPSF